MQTRKHIKHGATLKSHMSRKIKFIKNMTQEYQNPQGQTVIINQTEKKSNGIGTAGFVLALIAIFLGWVPVLGWILWLLGLIFSFVGVFKTPKGLSILTNLDVFDGHSLLHLLFII